MCLNEEHRSTAFEYTKPGAGSTSNTQGALTMPNFCVKCGSPLSGGPFCVKWGVDTRNLVSPAQVQRSQHLSEQVQGPQPTQLTPATVGPSTSVPPKQVMSALAKLGIAAVAIIFVGGAAGVAGVY